MAIWLAPIWRTVEHWGRLSFQACEDIAWVCNRFAETSRRREVLSFSHHREVASLEPEEADRLLDWCLEGVPENRDRRSTWELRQHVRRLQAEKAEKTAQRLVVSTTVHDIASPGATLIELVSDRSAPSQRPMLDESSVGGPVPPALANLKLEPLPELDRVAYIRSAFDELSPETQLAVVSGLAAELGYVLTPNNRV